MTQRDRIVVGVFAAIVVLAGSWFLAIKPKREEAARLADRAVQAEQRRATAVAKLANAKQAKRDFAAAQESIARMGKAVPADDDAASLVYQLERTARKSGIDFRAVRLEGGANPTPGTGPGTANPAGANAAVTPLPFKLVFEGGFFDLRRFLDLVGSFTTADGEKLNIGGRLLTVDGVGLTASRNGFPNLKAQITASAYLAPEPGKAAPGTAAAPGATPGAAPAQPATGGTSAPTTATVTGVGR